MQRHSKLSKVNGSFKTIKNIGEIAHKLKLPNVL